MTAGVAVSGVTQTITATVTTGGSYSISTTANGVTFAASGTFANTGPQDIVLTATGTPTASGPNDFTLNTTPNCTFSRTTLGKLLVSGAVTGNGRYATLADAFAAINGGAQTSATITISVEGNTDETTGTASLNAGTWTSLTITPIGPRTITGATVAGNPLINLNGADNVTINGLSTGGNSLTITNTTVSATAGTSTIRFINDASNNIIQNCTINGSSTGAAYGATLTTANIIIGTGTSTGNINNQILNNDIGQNGTAYPSQLITSIGTSTAITNNTTTISGNQFHDYFKTAGMAAINIGANSATFTISNNKFYQTVNQTTLVSISYSKAIVVNTTSGGGYDINTNIIGFNSSAGTTVLTNSGGSFTGIELTAVAASPVSSIQGNTINGINWTTASGAATLGASAFNGIYVGAGGVNIGTTTGNTIGATSGTGSSTTNIFFTTTVTGSGIFPIYVTSSTECAITNNNIGAIATGGIAAIGYVFTGIATAGTGAHTLSLNNVGNSTSGSIALGIVGTTTILSTVKGIEILGSGSVTVGSLSNGNTIQNIRMNAVATNAFTAITSTNTGATLNINYNTVKGIIFGATSATNTPAGAIGSPLKLTMAGGRQSSDGTLGDVGTTGYYWSSSMSSTITTAYSHYLNFHSTTASMTTWNRARGLSVRCLKD